MTPQTDSQANTQSDYQADSQKVENQNFVDKVLCDHCGRTATNKIKCQGICVADSNY